MKKLLISAIVIIVSVSQAYSLSIVKAYPDYTISVAISNYQDKSTCEYCYKVRIVIRDNENKESLKAWNNDSEYYDILLNGTGENTSYTKAFESIYEETNYTAAFNFAVEAAFHIAMIIQDAGKIPQIEFKKLGVIYNAYGTMVHLNQFTKSVPTGEWRDVK